MKKEEITPRIIAIVNSLKTSWVKHEVTPASNIRDEVGLESIDFLDMIQQVEMMFHIKITPEEAKDCKLVSDVIALSEQKINIQHSTLNNYGTENQSHIGFGLCRKPDNLYHRPFRGYKAILPSGHRRGAF